MKAERTRVAGAHKRMRLPLLQGILPLDSKRLPLDVLAGITLAALAIPEVMGYSSIAGMPVVTGLYTLLLPVLAFGLPGSESTVILLTAMLMHGLVPGKALLEQQLPLVFTLIWSLFLSNWLTSIIGLAVIRPAAKLARLRTDVLAPVILALVAISAVACGPVETR